MNFLTKFTDAIYFLSDNFLVYIFLLSFIASIIISIKMRFIQFRTVPMMLRMIFSPKKIKNQESGGISPRSALFISMSTTIGMSTIIGPIVAIGMGGPGALAGFILATLISAAITFVEVNLAMHYRTKRPDGSFFGGPMTYMQAEFGKIWGNIYAYFGALLMVAWSANQAYNLADLLEPKGISPYLTGVVVVIAVTLIMIGGVKRLSALSDRMVPFMFVLYVFATSWIVITHINQLPGVIRMLFSSLFSAAGITGAGAGFGVGKALRWGLARSMQANETGVGTNTFPHVASKESKPYTQGVLAMAAIYANGLICLLSGLSIMVTGAWLDSSAKFGIRMFSSVLAGAFPLLGPKILMLCAFMFAFGTILGNDYNGSQCFLYITKGRWIWLYHAISAIALFLGCISDAKFIWTIVDFFVLPVAIPHTIGIVILAFRKRDLFAGKAYEHAE